MNPLHFALVVGIQTYPDIGDLTAAHADAQDFYEWVTSPHGGGVPTRNARLILGTLPAPGSNHTSAQPTRERVHDAVDHFKEEARRIRPSEWLGTRFYFYGAGHGIAPDARDAALLAANARRNALGRHVSCTSLLEYFSRVQLFRELVLFADCCRVSTNGSVPRMPVEWNDDPIDNGAVRKFLACGSLFGRQAFEEMHLQPDERRGFFTRALLDGLHGAPTAINAESGRITSTLLKEHIAEQMRRTTEGRFRSPLEPDFVDEGPGELLFGPAGERPEALPLHPVQLEVRTVQVTGLDVLTVGSAPILSATRDPGNPEVFTCKLPVGLYEAVPLGVAPRPPGEEWLFKVIEGGVRREF